MKNSVELIDGFEWDPAEIEKDWKEKLFPHMENTGLLQVTFTEEKDDEKYTYHPRTKIHDAVKGTVFERILNEVPINLNRAVFVAIPPGMCLRHHNDPDNKYHVSVIENPGSFYYDFDKEKGFTLPADGKLRRVNSAESHHTAVNAGVDYRVHLVMTEYVCEELNPSVLYHTRFGFDAAECNVDFYKKADLRTTIEQNVFMEFTQKITNTKKVFKIKGSNPTLTSRVYDVYWLDEQSFLDSIDSDSYWIAEEVLKQFNIKLWNEAIGWVDN